MKKVIIITGQTATGKTRLAVQKALQENGELVNCDSRQIYKKLDIITGKDRADIPVKIWLYDIVDPKEYFSSFDYNRCALSVIKDILHRKKTPVIVGGTYLYLQHVLYQKDSTNIPADWRLRNELDTKTVPELQDMLKKTDRSLFDSLNESDQKNPRRLMRKIEIARAKQIPTKISSTIILGEKLDRQDLAFEYIGLRFADKQNLHTAIEKRVDSRLHAGAIEEIKTLLQEGYAPYDPGLQTIGYRQLIQCMEGKTTKEQAIQTWKIREHQYAKRQYTFMKKDPHIVWKDI